MRAAGLAAACLVAAACGGKPAPVREQRGRGLASLVATPAGPDDVVVATVDGRPVYASCVAAQGATHPDAADPRRAGLDDCVALELAAQEAERRGITTDPDVLEETARVRAAALVDREFTAKYQTIADLPASLVDDIFRRNAARMSRPEYRSSFFARVDYQGPRGTPEDLAAERTARNAYDFLLAGRTDLFPADVHAALWSMRMPGQVLSENVPEAAVRDSILQPYYRDPLFKLTSIGEVAPPARGPYGWDLILYTDQLPALEQTREQILDALFPRIRMRWFQMWTSQMEQQLGGERYYDDKTLGDLLGGGDES